MESKSMLLSLFVQYVLPVVGTGVAALLGLALQKVLALLGARTQSTQLASTLMQVGDSVGAAVRHVEQTLRPAIQEATADGKVTPEEAAKLKQAAVDAVKAELGDRLGGMAKLLGLTPEGVENFLARRIEAAVHELPSSRPQ